MTGESQDPYQEILLEIDELELDIQASPANRMPLIKSWLSKQDTEENRRIRVFAYEIIRGRSQMGSTPPSIKIDISGTVGNFNMGEQLGDINAHATTLRGKDDESKGLADALENLSKGIANSSLPETKKQEAIESLNEISEHASKKGSVLSAGVRAMLSHMPTLLAAAADATELWNHYGPIIGKFFGM